MTAKKEYIISLQREIWKIDNIPKIRFNERFRAFARLFGAMMEQKKKTNRKTWLQCALIMLAVWVIFGVAVVLYAQWKHPEVFTPPAQASGSRP